MTARTSSFKAVVLACCLSMGSLTLAGCQTSQLAKYDNPSDACSVHRTALIQTEQDLSQPIIQGAVIGAMLGGLATGLATGNARAALGGALAGGLVGAAGGYYQAKAQQARNQAELVAAINSDARSHAGQFSAVSASVKNLRSCRKEQIASLRNQIRNKQITKEQAQVQRNQLQRAIQEDGDLMNAVLGHVDGRVNTFVEANQAALNAPDAQRALQNRQSAGVKQVAAAGRSVQQEINNSKNEINRDLQNLDRLV